MARSKGAYAKKGKSASPLRICGNCAHACFKLSKDEKNLISEVLLRYRSETVQAWLKSGKQKIFQVGSGAELDVEKTRFMQLAKTTCFCKVAGVIVNAVEFGCYLWLPDATS